MTSFLKNTICPFFRDGMTLSFHHHFRDGDYVINMVMEAVASLGIKDISICCSSLGTAQAPGESVDMLVTEYGIAVNPRRPELLEALKKTTLPLMTIEELRDIAYSIAGKPEPIEFGDRVVALIEYRDGTIIDTVRQMDS